MDPAAHGRLSRLRLFAASIAIAVGAIALMGWAANLPMLTRLAPDLPPLRPLESALLILAGAVLGPGDRRARPLAALIALSSLAVAAFYVSVQLSLGGRIDLGSVEAAPLTPGFALVSLLGGAALLLRPLGGPRQIWAAQLCALLTSLTALRGLLGFVPVLGDEGKLLTAFTSMPIPGAAAWLLIGLGALTSRPDAGFMRLALSDEPAGQLLRWLIAMGSAVPVVAVAVTEVAWRAGIFGTWTGFLLLLGGNLSIYYLTASAYQRVDAGRAQAELTLTIVNTELQRRGAERAAALERDQRYQTALFACSQTLLPQADTADARQQALGDALGHLLAATGASRVVLTHNLGDAEHGLHAELVASAYGPGYEPNEEQDALRQRPWPIPNFDLQENMSLGVPIAGTTEALIARFPEFRPVLEAMGVRALLNLSLRVNERWWGSLSFHDCERPRQWEEQELLLLRTAAELIGGTIQRWHDEDDLRRVEQERLSLERKLLETQHAESLGVLAEGIAHDFNNILAAILGHAELALLDIPPGSEAAASLDAIARGARRAADLTGQMLTYAGQGKLVSSAVDLSALAREVGELMRVTLPYEIELRYELAALPAVSADETKVRQLLLNLITNAAEAIAGAGAITIATGQQELGPAALERATFSAAAPGPACFIEVRDSGGGMDEATLARIFDPFFSTKFTGRGLGLAAVEGIVRAHRGALLVHSAPGAGAAFRVYFPLASG